MAAPEPLVRKCVKTEYAEGQHPAPPQGHPQVPILQPVTAGSIAVLDKKALLIGGYAPGGSLNQVLEWDFATKQWTQTLIPLPVRRSEAACVTFVPKDGVQAGGQTPGSASTQPTPNAPIPSQPTIVLFGGWDDAKVCGDLFVMKPTYSAEGRVTGQWELIEPTGDGDDCPCPRRMHSMTAYTNPTTGAQVVYLFGGYSGERRLNDLWELDVSTLKWKQIETSGLGPTPRDSVGLCADPATQRLILFGGFATARVGDLFTLDLSSFQWTKYPHIQAPSPRFMCFAVVSGNYALFGMGQDGNGPTNAIFQLNLQEMKWSVAQFEGDEIDPRIYFSYGVGEGGKRVLLFGGTNEKKFSTSLYELELDKIEGAPVPGKKK